ncbi:unnamed protein product [Lymnaea stagnalis]|uniref:Major facilitator superfamily (MFS) profile domain-containing protein n=1 Tax=Lymnaea stagnalis TaxID=6523 RepID=A0AAV2IMC3_LYMST
MKDSDQGAEVDNVLTSLGWMGRYQKIQFVVAQAAVIACAFHGMSVVFIGQPVLHKCAHTLDLNVSVSGENFTLNDFTGNSTGGNFSVSYGPCSIDITNDSESVYSSKCTGYEYEDGRDKSFVSEWDLVCEGEALSDVSQTVLSLGQMLGAFFLTGLADKFGRKSTFMVYHFLLFSASFIIVFLPDFVSFVVLRFFTGAFEQGTGLVGVVLVIELFPAKKRAFAAQFGSYLWPCALLLLCLCAYVTREVSWRYTQLLLTASSAHLILQWWLVDESIRWLVAEKRYAAARKIIAHAAKVNKVDAKEVMGNMKELEPTMELLDPRSEHTVEEEYDDVSEPMVNGDQNDVDDNNNNTKGLGANNSTICNTTRATTDGALLGKEWTNGSCNKADEPADIRFSAFFKNRNILMITCVSCYTWFTDSVTYYGLLMTSSSLADDLYLGFFLSVLVELPAAVAFSGLINRIGRKRCVIVFHAMTGVCLLASVILSNAPFAGTYVPGKFWINLGLSLLGKFAVTVGFTTIYLYTPEMYPTVLRNTGFGISSVAARIGGMVAPYSRTFERHLPWGPGTVFAALCLLVPVLTVFLPETNGHELPQTLAEIDEWLVPKKKKPREMSRDT